LSGILIAAAGLAAAAGAAISGSDCLGYVAVFAYYAGSAIFLIGWLIEARALNT